MEPKERGILKRDGIYFHSAAPFAKRQLFYPLWGAVYWLDAPYRVNRRYMEAYMVQYIQAGELHFELRGEHFIAQKNDLVLLNCQEPNHYWAEKPATVQWFHFHGEGVAELFDYIYAQNGNGLFHSFYTEKITVYLDQILSMLKAKATDPFQFSHPIYSILCELASPPPQRAAPLEQSMQRAAAFMKEHYAQPVTLIDIAAAANLSVYYFTRLFKKFMHVSPHAYLLGIRLDNAKKLLLRSDDNLENIALQSGFQSASHFIRAFKKATDMTPNTFRKCFIAGNRPARKP